MHNDEEDKITILNSKLQEMAATKKSNGVSEEVLMY